MNDIFISYAHMDDQVLDEDQKGWITKFHRVLRVKLGQLMGEPARACMLGIYWRRADGGFSKWGGNF